LAEEAAKRREQEITRAFRLLGDVLRPAPVVPKGRGKKKSPEEPRQEP